MSRLSQNCLFSPSTLTLFHVCSIRTHRKTPRFLPVSLKVHRFLIRSIIVNSYLSSSKLYLLQMEMDPKLASPSFLMSSAMKQQQLEHKRSHHNVPSRKASIMALKRLVARLLICWFLGRTDFAVRCETNCWPMCVWGVCTWSHHSPLLVVLLLAEWGRGNAVREVFASFPTALVAIHLRTATIDAHQFKSKLVILHSLDHFFCLGG